MKRTFITYTMKKEKPIETQIYLCNYFYQGQTWSVEIHATSLKDAEQRINAIGKGRVIGQLVCNIPLGIGKRRKGKRKRVKMRSISRFGSLMQFMRLVKRLFRWR